MRQNFLLFSARRIKVPGAVGWVGRVTGHIAGEDIAVFVGGCPLSGAEGRLRAVQNAERYAGDLAKDRGARNVKISASR